MTHANFITELFCRVDDRLRDLPKHPQAALWPSELVTLGLFSLMKPPKEHRWILPVLFNCLPAPR